MTQRLRNIVDLHCRTSASLDGAGLPPSVVSFFRRNRYRACSLTEINGVDSMEAAMEAAHDVDLEYLPGIELAARTGDGSEVRLLGYHFVASESLNALCGRLEHQTETLLEEFLARLFAAGIADIGEEDLRAEALARMSDYDVWKKPLGTDIITTLLTRQGALDKGASWTDLLAKACPDLGGMPLAELDEALGALRDSGAVVLLARPLAGGTDAAGQAPRLLEWLEKHVDGLEVYYPGYSAQDRRVLLDILRERGRPYTGGSDTRTFDKPERICLSDAPYECVSSLAEFRDSRTTRTFPATQ